MPFGHWPDWDACIRDMMGAPNNYPKVKAEATCGKLKKRLEGFESFRALKAEGNRRVVAQYVAVENMDKVKDVVPNHRLKEALDLLKSTDPRYANVNWTHTSYQIGHPLWRFQDLEGATHKTEVDEYGLWGITEIRNDGYRMADIVWKHILAGEKIGASIGITGAGDQFPITLDKAEIEKRGLPLEWIGAQYWDFPIQFIEPWSLCSKPMNQYVTSAQVLAKGLCVPCVEKRAAWYVATKRVKTMSVALQRSRALFMNELRQKKARAHVAEKKAAVQLKETQQDFDINKELSIFGEGLMQKYFPRKRDS